MSSSRRETTRSFFNANINNQWRTGRYSSFDTNTISQWRTPHNPPVAAKYNKKKNRVKNAAPNGATRIASSQKIPNCKCDATVPEYVKYLETYRTSGLYCFDEIEKGAARFDKTSCFPVKVPLHKLRLCFKDEIDDKNRMYEELIGGFVKQNRGGNDDDNECLIEKVFISSRTVAIMFEDKNSLELYQRYIEESQLNEHIENKKSKSKIKNVVFSGISPYSSELSRKLFEKKFDIKISFFFKNKKTGDFRDAGVASGMEQTINDLLSKKSSVYNRRKIKWSIEKKGTRLEAYRYPQCWRCQSWGHWSNYCTVAYVCAHCADNHETWTCNNKTSTPKCANCGETHKSYCKRCKVFLSYLAWCYKRWCERNRIIDSDIKDPIVSTNDDKIITSQVNSERLTNLLQDMEKRINLHIQQTTGELKQSLEKLNVRIPISIQQDSSVSNVEMGLTEQVAQNIRTDVNASADIKNQDSSLSVAVCDNNKINSDTKHTSKRKHKKKKKK